MSGLALLGVFAAANWSAVRDHAEAWWFACSRETRTTMALAPGGRRPFSILADLGGRPVIHDPRARFHAGPWASGWLEPLLHELRERGFRVIDQRFPRRAYVVVGYPGPGDPDFEPAAADSP